MKKSIALILCAAMLFSACACTDKTRNTRTTRETTDPSEESTEDTAESTTKDTTEDTSTETTEDTSKVTTGESTEESTTESASSESGSETTSEATTKATTEATTSSEETSDSSKETTSASSEETSSESSDPTSESTAQTSQGPDGNTILFAKDLTYLPAPIVKEQDLFFFQYDGMKSAQIISKSLPFFDFQGEEYDTVKKAVAETLSRHQEAVNSRYDLAIEEILRQRNGQCRRTVL